MSERRKNPRVRTEGNVTVTVLTAPDAPMLEGRSFSCTTRDLSAGGLRFCVHTEVPLESALELEVEIASPHDNYVHLGKVAWVGEISTDGVLEYLLGVRFTQTRDDRETNWRTFVSHRLEELADATTSRTA